MRYDTRIVVLMDKSSSMEPFKQFAIHGFNEFLSQQKSIPGKANLTLILFSRSTELIVNKMDIGLVEPLNSTTYTLSYGTALYDAIGYVKDWILKDNYGAFKFMLPKKNILVIITDGDEHSSKKVSREQVKDIITFLRNHVGMEIVLMAANVDAATLGKSIGIKHENIASFKSEVDSVRNSYTRISQAVASFRKTGDLGTGWQEEKNTLADKTKELRHYTQNRQYDKAFRLALDLMRQEDSFDIEMLKSLTQNFLEQTGDTSMAIKMLEDISELGDVLTMVELGQHYIFTKGFPKDTGKGLSYWKKAAQHDNEFALYAMVCLGNYYEQISDYEKAYQYFLSAAEKGEPHAMYAIGNLYFYGRYGTLDSSVSKLLESTIQSMPIMPWDTLSSVEVPNHKAAFDWFLKAAEKGITDAMNNIGVMYHFGQGVEKNDALSKVWLKKAIAAGYVHSTSVYKNFFEII